MINSKEQLRKALQFWTSIEGNLFWEKVSQWWSMVLGCIEEMELPRILDSGATVTVIPSEFVPGNLVMMEVKWIRKLLVWTPFT